jgi:hypothetical protein
MNGFVDVVPDPAVTRMLARQKKVVIIFTF